MVRSCESDNANMRPWSSEAGGCQSLSCEARANILDRPGRREAAGDHERNSVKSRATRRIGKPTAIKDVALRCPLNREIIFVLAGDISYHLYLQRVRRECEA
jgi:hypothetical protein